MRRRARLATGALATALLAGPAQRATGEDDWIGLDRTPPVLLGADAGSDENGDSLLALLIDAPFAPGAGFAGYYSTTEISDGDDRFDSRGFVSAIWLEVNALLDVELSHFFDGNDGELEQEALGLALDFNLGEWQLGIEFSTGDSRIFTRDVGVPLIDERVPDFIGTDVDGQGISLGNRGLDWYWRVSYQHYDYDRDLGGLASSRLLQQIVSDSAWAQSGLLVSERASLVVGHVGLDDELSLTLARDLSAIDDSEADALGLSWLHWGEGKLGYQLSASLPLPNDDEFGLVLGLRWLL